MSERSGRSRPRPILEPTLPAVAAPRRAATMGRARAPDHGWQGQGDPV